MTEQIKLIISSIILTILVLGIGGCVWYYKWSQSEIGILITNNTVLKDAVSKNEETIKSLKSDIVLMGLTLNKVNSQFNASRKENDSLRDKLAKHNLGYLAYKKPGLVSLIINKGAKDNGRCYEILSGSPLTPLERNATKKSEINSMCPNIANPLYKEKQ